MRHHARLDQRREDGTTARQHVTASAARGNAHAAATLEAHPYPESLQYLVTWAHSLVGRSGVGQAGYAPLSYREVEAWSRLMGQCPTPHEVYALMAIDAVLCHPDAAAEEASLPYG